MTQPVQEPSDPRAINSLNFGERQLRRRPAPPAGGSAVARARIQRKSTSNVNVLSANNTIIVGTAGSDVNTDSSIFSIGSHQDITLLVDGLYGFWGQSVWNTYNTTWREVAVFDITPAIDVVVMSGGSSSDLYDPAHVYGEKCMSAGAVVRLVVNQHSGGLQTLYGGGSDEDNTNIFEVRYLGTCQ